jgi:hypothetical protein
MTKQNIFTVAHKEAKFNKQYTTEGKKLTYSQNLSIALKATYAKAKVEKAIQAKCATFGDIDKYMIEALEAIKEGGKWNSVVYTKKRGTNDLELSVYVDGKYFGIGQDHKSKAAADTKRFEKAVQNLSKNNNERTEERVDTGLGYAVSRKNLHKAYEMGYDGIENLD